MSSEVVYCSSAPLRRCSFCRQPGHNIAKCDSDRLIEFETICENAVRNMATPQIFKEWLSQNYTNDQLLLKTFAMRKCKVNSRTNIADCIDLITQYIFDRYKILEPDEDEETRELLHALDELQILAETDLTHIDGDIELQVNEQYRQQYIQYMIDIILLFMTDREVAEPTNFNILADIDATRNEESSVENDCSICWDQKETSKFVKLNCKHEFCNECIVKTIAANKHRNPCCALCRAEITSITSRNVDVQTEITNALA